MNTIVNTHEVRKVVHYCSEEVRRQGRGPIEVGCMIHAWMDAIDAYNMPPVSTDLDNPKTIMLWGYTVEPTVNSPFRFRNVDVMIGLHKPPSYYYVTDNMDAYCANLNSMTAEDAYFEFEYIHPFADGNGRVGKIIYNWKLGTLLNPQWPPNKWGITNP